MEPERVLVLGLDGLDFDVITPLLEDGAMPVLAQLRQDGSWAKLRSVVPPISPAAWTTLCTGVNPGAHGITGFGVTAPNSYDTQVLRPSDVKAPQFWDYLAPAGKRTIVFALPHLHPPMPIAGVMVSGAMTPHAQAAWCEPRSLESELTAAGLGFRKRLSVNTAKRIGPARTAEAVTDHAAHQAATLRYLMRTQDWDLTVAVLDSPDLIQHILLGQAFQQTRQRDPRDMRALLATPAGQGLAAHFRDLDRLVGEILAEVPEGTATLVMSDHGFLPRPKVISLNQWLIGQGYLGTRRSGLVGAGAAHWRQRTVGAIMGSLHLRFLVPLLPEHLVSRVINVPRVGRLVNMGVPLWSRTKAFADVTVFCQGIRINLKGREPEGTVEPADYEALRAELMHGLTALRDPQTGEPVVTRAWRREALHPGAHGEGEPDIYLEYHPQYRAVPNRARSPLGYSAGAQGAGHGDDGILIARGRGIEAQGPLGQCQLLDLAPTVMTLLGLPVPEAMEGRPLPFLQAQAQAPTAATQVQIAQAPEGNAYTEDEEAEVRARLEDLGYM